MFAGKSSWIVHYVRRHFAAGIQGLVIKPHITARYSNENESNVVTHDQVEIDCLPWPMHKALSEIWNLQECKLNQASFIIVDESQFFTGLYNFTKISLQNQKQLVLVGLNGDYLQRPFYDIHSNKPEFLECISLADKIEMLHSLCEECCDGTAGHFTKKLS